MKLSSMLFKDKNNLWNILTKIKINKNHNNCLFNHKNININSNYLGVKNNNKCKNLMKILNRVKNKKLLI